MEGTLIDTGLNTMTGGRIKLNTNPYVGNETFMLTYGDAVADINVPALLEFHRNHGKIVHSDSGKCGTAIWRIGY